MKQNYAIIEEIGHGSYGTVYKAVNNTSGALVALKEITMEDESIMKEIEFMKSCHHDYLIGLVDHFVDSDILYIAMEFCPAGSIADVMKYTETTLSEKQIQSAIRDSLHGLEYLHKQMAIHRDIKAGNLLLNRFGRVKLGDFGVSASLSDAVRKRNTVIGTPYWMAPEIIQEIGYGTSADIWSLGITLIELADGKPPHHHIHPMRAIFMIPNKPPPTVSTPNKWSKKLIRFLSACLIKEADQRPSAANLLQHDFITSAPDSSILLELVQHSLEVKSRRKLEPKPEYDTIEPMESGTVIRNDTMIRHDTIDSNSTIRPRLVNDSMTIKPNKIDLNQLPTTQKMIPELLANMDNMTQLEMEEYIRVSDRNLDKEILEIQQKYQRKTQPIKEAMDKVQQ